MAYNDPFFGQAIGLNTKYRVLEDATKLVSPLVATGAFSGIYAGRAVSLQPGGANKGLMFAAQDCGNVRPYGLAKANKNSSIDETSGAFGAYGSGQLTVVLDGIVTVKANAFPQADGSEVVVPTFDASFLSANVGAPVYVNLTAGADLGKLTTTLSAGVNDQTQVGWLNSIPATLNDAAEIRVSL